jgi:hypothetical protein
MTDKYTIEEIGKAIHDEYMENDFGGSTDFPEKVIKRLTKPEYEFREGEVAINKASGAPMLVAWPEDMHEPKSYRPLNQTEVGPDWIPCDVYNQLINKYSTLSVKYSELADKCSEFENLQIALKRIASLKTMDRMDKSYDIAMSALAALDEVIEP